VDHDCEIGDFSHISPGATIAGEVKIGARTWVGAGATVSNGISVCDGCIIGAGAVAVKDITEPGTYIGVPAKKR
jgi:acetyltransferase-like isoleucine patch superfamily enzyme